jgi:hypothetical protein
MSLLQLTSSVQAAPFSTSNNVSAIGSLEGSSSGSGVDMTLNKARWSLPSCEKLKSAEPPKATADEEEFDTPASVEAKAKKEAALKKASRKAAAAQVAPAVDAGDQTDSTMAAEPKTNAPMVRLTLTPAANQVQASVPAKIARKAVATPAPVNTISPAVDPNLMDSQSSSVSSRPEYNTAPMPGSGAPLPGRTPGTSPANMRPSKTAAKANTQA